MKLLAIDSAFEPCSVALWLDGAVTERFDPGPRSHAERILPFVEELLSVTGLTLSELDAIAFNRGPGSFTSLRIGIGVVQGLAWGAQLPVVPVSSLRTVAQVAAESGVERACVAMDARMGEVFTGCFALRDGVMESTGRERVCAPADAVPSDALNWTGVGNGFERFEALAAAPMGCFETDVWPRAGVLAALAVRELADDPGLPAEQAQPVYLRDRVASKPA